MARIRTIKPAFFRDGDLYDLEVEANRNRDGSYLNIRVAFAGLFTAADREGRFKWDARELKLDCLPHDPIDFQEVLDALARPKMTPKDLLTPPKPFIHRYIVDGHAYGVILEFTKHQRPKDNEPPSSIPAPPGPESQTDGTKTEPARHPRGYQTAPARHSRGTMEVEREVEVEVEKEMEGRTDCSEPQAAPKQPVLIFPVVGNQGKSWPLTRQEVGRLQEAFPSIDIVAEARKAIAWAQANPAKRKTPRGMPKFLYAWMERTQNGGRNGQPIRSGSTGHPTRGHAEPTADSIKRFENL